MKRAGWAACVAAALIAGSAHADDPAAVAFFNEGRAMLEKGRLEEACDRFSRSQELEPAVGTVYSLAECYERRGMMASAWVAYLEAASLATSLPNKQNAWRAPMAKQAAAKVESRLSYLTIAPSPTPNVSVARNSVAIKAASLGAPFPVDAGKHVITATSPTGQSWQTTVELREGASASVRVPALESSTPPPSVSTPTPAPAAALAPTPSSRPSDHNTLAIGLEIGGGSLTAAGLVFGGLAASSYSSAKDGCPGLRCEPNDVDRLQPDVDTARTFAYVSTVGVAVGLIAIATGIVLHLKSHP